MVDVDQTWDFPDGRPVAPQLIGVHDFWNVVFPQQPDEEGFRSLGVVVALKEDALHQAVLVYCPLQPMPDAVHARTDLIGVPGGAVLPRTADRI